MSTKWHEKRKEEVRKIFGQNVIRKRHEKDLSQAELAERAGISLSYLGSVERGKRNLALENIVAIALALECCPKDIMPAFTVENKIEPKEKKMKYECIPIEVSYTGSVPRILYRPENEVAKDLAVLMRKKQFSKADVDKLRQLGFVVKVGELRAVLSVPEHLR